MPRLLLIEDDRDISKLLDRYLQRAGLEVVVAVDGEEGLKIFFHDHFDIVLVDGLLPKKSGLEVVPAIRAMPRGKDIGIIMMTAAFKTPKARKEAFDGGVDAFFTKPFVLQELKAKIDELLRRRGLTLPMPTSSPMNTVGPAPTRPASPPGAANVGFGAAPRSAPQAAPAPVGTAPTPVPLPRTATPVAVAAPRPVPLATPPLPAEVGVRSPRDVARVLLQCARHRLTGVVRLSDEANELVIAFFHGVVVGATDNLREQLLGEMLWKQGRLTTEQMRDLALRMADTGERVAEALLALGFTTPEATLALVDEQARARVRRALLWTGTLRVSESEEEAMQRAVDSVDLLDVLLAFALEPAQLGEAERFVAAHKGRQLARGRSFDEVLQALARTKPASTLPGVLLAGEPTVSQAASASSAAEVYAAHLAELVRFADEPVLDPRSLPTTLRADASAPIVDRALADRVCGLLLRARGRSAYALFGKPRTATDAEMKAVAEALLAELGKEILTGGSLGPAQGAARELWTILEEYREIFSDPVRRALHDAVWGELPAPRPRGRGPEDDFLDGQLALSSGDLAAANARFAAALEVRPLDPEYRSWSAWARLLAGDEQGGVQALMAIMRDHPQSMRPMFFLGLHAARAGERDRARALLLECARRAPHDVEVQAALGSLD